MEVALDPAASVVGGLDDAGARLLELDPRVDVGDRLGDELGERADKPELVVVVGAGAAGDVDDPRVRALAQK